MTAMVVTMVLAGAAAAQTPTDERLKDEMGLKRLKVIYPEAGATVAEPRPAIAVDASGLGVPIDSKTVIVTFNGVDVTDNSEINAAYIIYEPPQPLPVGDYEVRITAKNIKQEDIEPLSWTFRISAGVPEEAPAAHAAAQPALAKKDNTTGKLSVSTDYINAEYTPQPAIDISQLFAEKEGMKLNSDLSFTNTSEGRTLIGSYHRETQYYTDVEIDKGRLNYYDANFKAVLGSFWTAYSDLTIIGAEMNGAMFEKEDGPFKLQLFSGRTQDPSTSGTFKQNTTGLRGAYAWGKRNTTTVTLLSAYEKDDAVYGQTSRPAEDKIAALRHDYVMGGAIKANIEVAQDFRRVDAGGTDRNGAAKLGVSARFGDITGELAVYRIAEGFVPIAEGSAKFLKTDRHGVLLKGAYALSKLATFGGEYEQYDEFSKGPLFETKRGNAFVTLNVTDSSSLTYRKMKLTRYNTLSETDAANAIITLPSTRLFAESRITLGWQDIDYRTTGVVSNTKVKIGTFSTAYKDILRISFSHSVSDTGTLAAILTETENKTSGLNLFWNIIPFKFFWSGSYQITGNTGNNNTDNDEKRLKTMFKYVVSDTCTVNLGLDTVSYKDAIGRATDYDQRIIRTGIEWSF